MANVRNRVSLIVNKVGIIHKFPQSGEVQLNGLVMKVYVNLIREEKWPQWQFDTRGAW